MKKTLIVFTLVFSFIGLQANEKVVVLENLIRINNSIVQQIEGLSIDKQAEYYQKISQIKNGEEYKTDQYLHNLNVEIFGSGASEMNNKMAELATNITYFRANNYSEEDYQAFAALHPNNVEPPAAPCKCMPCFQKCNSWMEQIGISFNAYFGSLATFSAIGTVLGGTIGSAAGPEGTAVGAFSGSQYGLVIGAIIGSYEAGRLLMKKGDDCWAIHCEGKDLNPEGMGGGMPPGGPKWKKFEWGGF